MGYISPGPFARARSTADYALDVLGLPSDWRADVGLVLGTGWVDALRIEDKREIPLRDLIGFDSLKRMDANPQHPKKLLTGTLHGHRIAVLQGRIHHYESIEHPGALCGMVRLQTEMLVHMGSPRFRLVVTSAVGSRARGIRVGDLAFPDGFIDAALPSVREAEFVEADAALDAGLRRTAMDAAHGLGFTVHTGPHKVVRQLEGRKYDKFHFRRQGAVTIGMSMYPEMEVAAIYGVPALGVGFASNDDEEDHDGEAFAARAKGSSEKLGALLSKIIACN